MFFGTRRFPTTILALLVLLVLTACAITILAAYIAQSQHGQRRNFCLHRMRGLAEAVIKYEADHGQYPGYRMLLAKDAQQQDQAAGWVFCLLPYLDRNDLYAKYGPDGPDATRGTPPREHIPDLICPAGPRLGAGACSFVANAGQVDVPPTADIPADWPANGMFFDLLPQMAGGKPARLVTLSAEELQAGDGLFTTWMISENLDSGDWRGGREPEVGFVWLASERPPGVARINGRRPQGAQVAPYDLTRPSSNHAGGVNGLFADGHFQFIAESIDYRVYRQLMTTNEAHARPVGLPAQ